MMSRSLSPELIHAYDIRADYRFLYHLVARGRECTAGDYRFWTIYDDIYIVIGDSKIILSGDLKLVYIRQGNNAISISDFKHPLIQVTIHITGETYVSILDKKSDVECADIILAIYDDFMTPLLTSLKVCMTVMR